MSQHEPNIQNLGLTVRARIVLLLMLVMGASAEIITLSMAHSLSPHVQETMSLVGQIMMGLAVVLISYRAGARMRVVFCMVVAAFCIIAAQSLRLAAAMAWITGDTDAYNLALDIFDGTAPTAVILGFFLMIFQLDFMHKSLEKRKDELALTVEQVEASESALRKSQSALFEAQSIAKIGHWEYVYASDAMNGSNEFYNIFGLDKAVSQRNDLVVHLEETCRNKIIEYIRKGIAQGESWDDEFTLVFEDGRTKIIYVRGEPIRDEKGVLLSLLGTVQDITARKQMELAERVYVVREQQNRHLQNLGVMAGGMVHDYNNILNIIMGNTELAIYAANEDKTILGYLEGIQTATGRASELTRQMLLFAGKGAIAPTGLNVSDVIKALEEFLTFSIAKEHRLYLELDTDIPIIYGDKEQLKQVLINLLTNAVEANEYPDSAIYLRTGTQVLDESTLRELSPSDARVPGTYVYMEIQDHGKGITEGELEQIFDPFFSTKFLGRGLGMAAVQGIVRSHEGVISLESAVGKGTTVRVLLPVRKETATLKEDRT